MLSFRALAGLRFGAFTPEVLCCVEPASLGHGGRSGPHGRAGFWPLSLVALLLGVVLSSVPMGACAQPTHNAATVPPQQVEALLPPELFFGPSAFRSPVLSPDGRRIAMIVPGDKGQRVLALSDVRTPGKPVGLLKIGNTDVGRVWWINANRLLFNTVDRDAAGNPGGGGFMFAIDVDGKDYVELGWQSVARLLRDGSDDVIVTHLNRYNTVRYDAGSLTPKRLNTRTRRATTLLEDEPRFAVEWIFSPTGEPVAARGSRWNGDTRIWWREDKNSDWQEIERYELFDQSRTLSVPLGVLPDGRLLVRARRDDAAGTAALFGYDPKQRQLESQPILAIDGFDFTGDLIFDTSTGELVGASYVSDALGVAWLDPALRRVQQRIDALLPATNNFYICDPCGGQSLFVVTAYSDRQPPVYFLFDSEAPEASAMQLIGTSRPGIVAQRMAQQDFVRVPARDGQSVPVFVTRPAGKGPWPTVVLVHGGPWDRGAAWGWEPQSQFLASRGYLVLEPEFRGSVGFGDKWYRAGFKQWGLAMQDDLTDTARWAIGQGLADPERVAIAGASYGGYAAMMGLLKEPKLFRAAINWVGVTDIELMFSVSWSDFAGGLWHREGMPVLIGDPGSDSEKFRRASPLRRAKEIQQPVLMAYGARDQRVPIVHGTRMRDALREAGNTQVEWVAYEDEGHGFRGQANLIDFWTRVEQFLARHLN